LLFGCNIQKREWEKAESENTVSAYEDFLNKYPEGELADKAKVKIEEIFFKAAESENTVSAYENFLNKYPEGELADKAKVKIEKFPKLEKLDIDTSKSITENNAYGQPSVVISNDGYPITEYIWEGAWIDKVTVNFYVKNSRGSGKSEIFVSIAETKGRIFDVKADTNYIVRVTINQFGSTGPWNMTPWVKYPVILQASSFKDSIIFEAPQAFKLKSDKFNKLMDFEIRLEKLPGPGKVDSSNLPDKEWFDNSIWEYKYKYCLATERYILLRSDGLFGHNDNKPEDFKVDGDETWEIKDGILILSWNKGYALVKYKLTNKNTSYLFGTHSNSAIPFMLHRIKKDK